MCFQLFSIRFLFDFQLATRFSMILNAIVIVLTSFFKGRAF